MKLNDERIKASHELKVGDALSVRVGDYQWIVAVKKLSERRGPASEARLLYEETTESRVERERRQDLRKWGAEPAHALRGRPTKRDRRRIEEFTGGSDES